MFCIASFIVLLVLSAVSAKYRPLLKKGWHCVSRRVTFRPCDTTFREEVKTTLLARVAVSRPRLVKPLSGLIEVGAWTMVVSMVVTAYVVVIGGLNLLAFGTCNRHAPESCDFGAAACGIAVEEPTFWGSLTQGDVIGAFRNEWNAVGDIVAALPNRFRNWDVANYTTPYASFNGGYVPGRPMALEVIDPGCGFCAQLYANMMEAGFSDSYNVTYVLFPITRDGGFEFANSMLTAQYLTAVQIVEREANNGQPVDNPTDWYMLQQIFVGPPGAPVGRQLWLNEMATPDQAVDQFHEWMLSNGMSPEQVQLVDELANSQRVADLLERSREIVTNEIRTVHIPTLIVDGHRLQRGLVSVEDLISFRDSVEAG